MATEHTKSMVQEDAQDTITMQDLFYLCLNKWRWFVISLILCLGLATFYLLITPPVYLRTAAILIKEDAKGKPSLEWTIFQIWDCSRRVPMSIMRWEP